MKVFSALVLASCVVAAAADACGDKYSSQTTCDADKTCTWCKCAALPSACWTLENAGKLPSGVYECDKKVDTVEATVELSETSTVCDGPNFKCNATAGNITNIHNVMLTTPSGTFVANETAILNFSAQLSGQIDLSAGTTHYKIWEGGVPQFRVNGAADYYQCGPAPAGCDKSKPISLFIDQPTNATSLCHVQVSFVLPEAISSGIFTVDFYGEDEYHEPYDFAINVAYHYTK